MEETNFAFDPVLASAIFSSLPSLKSPSLKGGECGFGQVTGREFWIQGPEGCSDCSVKDEGIGLFSRSLESLNFWDGHACPSLSLLLPPELTNVHLLSSIAGKEPGVKNQHNKKTFIFNSGHRTSLKTYVMLEIWTEVLSLLLKTFYLSSFLTDELSQSWHLAGCTRRCR